MEGVLATVADATDELTKTIPMTDRMSFVMGWVSISCWVIVYTPQIQENYALKSTEGISIWFILIWLGGDAFNLFGGLLQGVLLTMINLAGYYCLCDLILVWQWWYYSKYYKDGKRITAADEENSGRVSEDTPLLGSSQRKGLANTLAQPFVNVAENFENLLNYFTPKQVAFMKYTLTSAFVIVTGVIAYITSANGGAATNDKAVSSPSEDGVSNIRWDAQVLGWLSAFLYLSSRIPQIFKNRHTKCAGLSLALFIFAVAGNITYVASILLKDTSTDYLIENASWIMGSVGTIFLDFIVLYQFIVYAPDRRRIEANYPHHL